MQMPIFGEERAETVQQEDRFATTNAMLTSTAEALKQAIKKNPGVALLISAGIGVALACLIKRR